MKLRQLFSTEEERAVSPVIGVILMVAITVILAAVIGTFVLGLGDQVQDTAPNSNFAFDYEANSDLTITHDGGSGIDHQRLTVRRSGASTDATWDWHKGDSSIGTATSEATVSAGDQFQISEATGTTGDIADGDTVRVVWTAQGGSQSSTVARWTGPDA